MKRERDSGKAVAPPYGSEDKSKMCEEEVVWPQPDAGMDELFAVLGYTVKSSDMATVAEMLQQLDVAMCTSDEDGVSMLSSDVVHYNPSDISGWVESMLTEFNNPGGFETLPNPVIPGESSGKMISFSSGGRLPENGGEIVFDDDLRAIPGGAIFNGGQKYVVEDSESSNKRMKSAGGYEFHESEASSSSSSSGKAARPVVVDSQETGVRLVHTLMACAEAVQQDNKQVADALVKHSGSLAVSQVGAMRKVATYFAEALARKIYRIHPQDSHEFSGADLLQMHFYETGPYLKFAHFTANQAILEAFSGADRVHVIDFSLNQGMQWPALMQALALRPGGPPAFRLTGIGPPQPDDPDSLQQVGWKLGQLAKTIGVDFDFHGIVVNSPADLDIKMLNIKPSKIESLAVNSVLELHRLLARRNSIERTLNSIREMNPKIVTIVEQEADHNSDIFLERFNEALHYYSTIFDSLESSCLSHPNSRDSAMTEMYLGLQICNVVASDGADRVERHEPLAKWRVRMNSSGFEPVHMGSNAFKQASMLLALFSGGDGYRVEENDGCLMLGWHTRPLIATSAWRLKTVAQH